MAKSSDQVYGLTSGCLKKILDGRSAQENVVLQFLGPNTELAADDPSQMYVRVSDGIHVFQDAMTMIDKLEDEPPVYCVAESVDYFCTYHCYGNVVRKVLVIQSFKVLFSGPSVGRVIGNPTLLALPKSESPPQGEAINRLLKEFFPEYLASSTGPATITGRTSPAAGPRVATAATVTAAPAAHTITTVPAIRRQNEVVQPIPSPSGTAPAQAPPVRVSGAVPVTSPGKIVKQTIPVPNQHFGKFTQNGEALLKAIRSASGAKINSDGTPQTGRLFRVEGSAESVRKAVDRIKEELNRLDEHSDVARPVSSSSSSGQSSDSPKQVSPVSSSSSPVLAGSMPVEILPNSPPAILSTNMAVQEPAAEPASVCILCEDAEATWQFVPCGHKNFCEECAKKAFKKKKECPCCRTAAETVWLPKVYT